MRIESLRIPLLAMVLASGVSGADANRPSFLFFLADDLGWADLGSYGNRIIETPNIDRLAAGGMRFTNAYSASPVCSPTRASLQTGLYPARVGMNAIVNPHRRPWALLTPPDNRWSLPQSTPTVAGELRRAGYVSTIIGKWNLGYDHPDMPADRGYVDQPAPETSELDSSFRGRVASYARDNPHKGLGGQTLRAAAFLQANRDNPFFCVVSYNAVHIPSAAREDLVAKYRRRLQGRNVDLRPEYAAMTEAMDESVGLLLDVADSLGIGDNTVVFFYSDNGGLIRVYHGAGAIITTNHPLRSEKGTLYEGGIRVPLIVRWPGRVHPGSTSEVPVTSTDFLPTLLEMAGVELRREVDGLSLVPALGGGGLGRGAIFWHYPFYHHATPAAAVRQGDFKLIYFYETEEAELYNLAADPGERKDLASSMPAKAGELRKLLFDWQRSVNAAEPTRNPAYDPSKAHIFGNRPQRPWEPAPPGALDMEEACRRLLR